MHGKFKTRKLMTCVDPQYRNVTQCQNIIYVLNEHEIIQPKLRMIRGLTDINDSDINDTQSNIIEELIHGKSDEIVLNRSASKPEKPNQILGNNQNKDVTQTKVQIKPSHHSLKKIKCMHCKNYIYM